MWTVNVGQVYTTLDRLHADGLVQPVTDEATGADQGSRDRRRWELTPAGKGALDDWFDEVPSAYEPQRPPDLPAPDERMLGRLRDLDDEIADLDDQMAALDDDSDDYQALLTQKWELEGKKGDLEAQCYMR